MTHEAGNKVTRPVEMRPCMGGGSEVSHIPSLNVLKSSPYPLKEMKKHPKIHSSSESSVST